MFSYESKRKKVICHHNRFSVYHRTEKWPPEETEKRFVGEDIWLLLSHLIWRRFKFFCMVWWVSATLVFLDSLEDFQFITDKRIICYIPSVLITQLTSISGWLPGQIEVSISKHAKKLLINPVTTELDDFWARLCLMIITEIWTFVVRTDHSYVLPSLLQVSWIRCVKFPKFDPIIYIDCILYGNRFLEWHWIKDFGRLGFPTQKMGNSWNFSGLILQCKVFRTQWFWEQLQTYHLINIVWCIRSVNHGRPPGANAAELDRGFSLLLGKQANYFEEKVTWFLK